MAESSRCDNALKIAKKIKKVIPIAWGNLQTAGKLAKS